MMSPPCSSPIGRSAHFAIGNCRSQKRRGFTIVELLIVVAIIGMLVALLLPAIGAAREASRNTQCKNNLRQIGLGFRTHESAHRYFPTGGWHWYSPPTYAGATPQSGDKQQAGWGFQLLPFVEAESVWKSGAENAVGTVHSMYFCPSRRAPQTVVAKDSYSPQINGGLIERALCDYAASNREGTGIVRRFEPLPSRKVTDGQTKTILVGEKRMNLALLGEPQDDDNEGYAGGWTADVMRNTDKSPMPDHRGMGDGEKRFGASHRGSWNAVFGDGAVHALNYDLDYTVLRNLGNVNDGTAIDMESLH